VTAARQRLRKILASPVSLSVAPIFDPLSARVAELVGWEVVKISGSVAKYASLAVPDGVPMANVTDLADVCRRITRITDVSLIVDADDGGSALGLRRTVRELEDAGVAAMEIEDNLVPSHFIEERHAFMVSKEEHVRKLEAAVAAKRDPDTVIVGRTTALYLLPLEEALDRVRAYSQTGVDALMMPGLGKQGLSPNPREDIAAVHEASGLPLFLSGLPDELVHDEAWLLANDVRLRFNAQATYRMAVQAMYDALTYLKGGGRAEDLRDRWIPSEIADALLRTDDLKKWDEDYGWTESPR
jgi:carboxyvinyl-carboxyphosphonate phosphorylmutase